jgi:hypothetical protein
MGGMQLGVKYNDHKFLEMVEHCGVVCARCLLVDAIGAFLPSLGIPSDIILVWNGVALGGSMFSRAETLCVIGIGFVDTHGKLVYRLLSSPSENMQRSGDAQVALVLRMLREHPTRLTVRELRERLALVGGLGANVRGGPEAKHQSTGAADKFWSHIHPELDAEAALMCVDWDLWHRVMTAITRAMNNSRAVQEVMDVGHEMGFLFGVGEAGGTRSLQQILARIAFVTRSCESVVAGMHARLGLAHAHVGAQSIRELIHLGRRVSSMAFVAFALALHDLLDGRVSKLSWLAETTCRCRRRAGFPSRARGFGWSRAGKGPAG